MIRVISASFLFSQRVFFLPTQFKKKFRIQLILQTVLNVLEIVDEFITKSVFKKAINVFFKAAGKSRNYEKI